MDKDSVARFRTALSRVARDLNTAATDRGLAPTEASLLALIGTRGPIAISELTELEGLHPTMVSRAIRKLEASGLIQRVVAPVDKRTAYLVITKPGVATQTKIRESRIAIMAACISRLSEEHVADLENAIPALEALTLEVRKDAAEWAARRRTKSRR